MTTKQEIQKLQLDIKQVTRTKSILNENQVQKLFNSTPKRYQYTRPAKGGGNWNYVRAGYVRRTLDSVFGYDWSFDLAPESKDLEKVFNVAAKTGSVVVFGTFRGVVRDERGNELSVLARGDSGSAEVKFKKGTRNPLNFGNDVKAAVTDCFKRCAARLGVAADIYDPSEFIEIEIIGADEVDNKAKNRERLIKQAKKELGAEGKEVSDGRKN